MERDSTRMKYKKHCFDREEPQLPWKDSWAEGRQSALSGFSTPAAKPAGDRPHPRSLAAVLERHFQNQMRNDLPQKIDLNCIASQAFGLGCIN